MIWVSPWHRPDLCRPAYPCHLPIYLCHRHHLPALLHHRPASCHPSFSSNCSLIVVIFDFNACSVTASIVFCVLSLAALLRALFFTFQRLQHYCEHCFLRFNACSVTASAVFCVLSLAALLRALFFAFYPLQRYCEHCFLRFSACSVTASIKTFIFTFAERRCAFGMVGAAPMCPPERPRSGVSINKIYLRITHHARGFNDGCALAGRHGRAHRHRPYPSPSYPFAPFH